MYNCNLSDYLNNKEIDTHNLLEVISPKKKMGGRGEVFPSATLLEGEIRFKSIILPSFVSMLDHKREIKESNLQLNPAISNLHLNLDSFLNKNKSINISVFLHKYGKSVLSLSLNDIASKYGKNIDYPIAKLCLPKD